METKLPIYRTKYMIYSFNKKLHIREYKWIITTQISIYESNQWVKVSNNKRKSLTPFIQNSKPTKLCVTYEYTHLEINYLKKEEMRNIKSWGWR